MKALHFRAAIATIMLCAASACMGPGPDALTGRGIAPGGGGGIASGRLEFLFQPSDVAAGTPIGPPEVKVEAVDTLGNVLRQFSGTVRLVMGERVRDTTRSGMVLAARADHPFRFAGFTTGDHWSVAAPALDSATTDPEAAMLRVADLMTDGHYDYDTVSYTVGTRWYGPGVAIWYGPYLRGYGLWSSEPYSYYGPRIGFGITVVPEFFLHGRR